MTQTAPRRAGGGAVGHGAAGRTSGCPETPVGWRLAARTQTARPAADILIAARNRHQSPDDAGHQPWTEGPKRWGLIDGLANRTAVRRIETLVCFSRAWDNSRRSCGYIALRSIVGVWMQLRLTALLLRGGVTPVGAITENSRACVELQLWSDGKLERIEPEDAELATTARAGELVVALLDRPADQPAWQQFLNQALGVPFFTGTPASRGAIIFCPIDGAMSRRWLAWCFGSGSRALRRAATDSRFGLVVALNALAQLPESSAAAQGTPQVTSRPYLRDVATRTTLGPRQRSSHRAARSVPPEAFRVDRRSDLVGSVGGRSHDPLLGVVKGGRSLAFRSHVEQIDDLVILSSQVLERASDDGYKATFGWVDRLTLVDDDDVRQALIEQLANDLLADQQMPDADVMLPDDLLEDDDERSIEFVLFPGERRTSASRTTLTLGSVATHIGRSPDPRQWAHGLEQPLRFLDGAKGEVGIATMLECLAADLTNGGDRYVAHEGDFYRVEESFVNEVDEELRDLPESTLRLPCYHGDPEPQFNRLAAETDPARFVLLDGQLFHASGETGVELCDLLADTGALVHVKRKGRSSVLSHLFLQAANGCDVLRRSKPARERLSEMIRASTASPDLIDTTLAALAALERRDGGPEVVFAFLGDFRSNRIVDLPLFSKVSLVQVVRTLGWLGYHTSYKLVALCRTGHPLRQRGWN